MKCTTLAELQYAVTHARARGEEPPVLTLDNDEVYAYQGAECVFRSHPDILLEQALDLLGIPHQAP